MRAVLLDEHHITPDAELPFKELLRHYRFHEPISKIIRGSHHCYTLFDRIRKAAFWALYVATMTTVAEKRIDRRQSG